MSTVQSPIRRILKPILFKLFGKTLYPWFQYRAKVKDIDLHLVDEDELDVLPWFISRADEAIDIGANYGYYAVPMGRLAKKVYAFEPIPFTYGVCKKVLAHYKLFNVALFKQGVGEKKETRVFNVPVMDFGAISAGQAHFGGREDKEITALTSRSQDVICEVISIDDMASAFEQISFVKMDIEGAEYFALKGMVRTLEKFKPAILIEINPQFLMGFGIAESDLNELIHKLGYEVFMYRKDTGKLVTWNKEYIEDNYILLHRDKRSRYSSHIADQ
jgi:FkbM family methyltransferase